MKNKSSKSEFLPVFYKLHVVRISLLPSPMETVQIIVPNKGNSCYDDSRKSEETHGESEYDVFVIKHALCINIGCPNIDKDLDYVSDDGKYP